MKIDEWIAGLKNKPTSYPSAEYHEGRMVRDLIKEYTKEQEEEQWNNILKNICQSGLLEVKKRGEAPLHSPPPVTTIEPPLPSFEVARNESRFLWVAASLIACTSIGIGAYLFSLKPLNKNQPNLNSSYYSTEGLILMRGESQIPQFILVPKGKTPKQVALQVEEILYNHSIRHDPAFETSNGRIQFIVTMTTNSPARVELKKKLGLM